MRAHPSDLVELLGGDPAATLSAAQLEGPGVLAAFIEICERLEPDMSFPDAKARAQWRIGLGEAKYKLDRWVRSAAIHSERAIRAEVLFRLRDAAQTYWRGPTGGAAVKPLPFIRNPALRHIAERDMQSARGFIKAEETKAALIMCGSAIEAALQDVIELDPPATDMAAGKLTRDEQKQYSNQSQRGWLDFSLMIPLCGPRGLAVLSAKAVELAELGKDWRNFAHPGVERGEAPVTPSDAALAHALAVKVLEEVEAHAKRATAAAAT